MLLVHQCLKRIKCNYRTWLHPGIRVVQILNHVTNDDVLPLRQCRQILFRIIVQQVASQVVVSFPILIVKLAAERALLEGSLQKFDTQPQETFNGEVHKQAIIAQLSVTSIYQPMTIDCSFGQISIGI